MKSGEEVYKEAEKELEEEMRRQEIEDAKTIIRERRANKRWWHDFFPYKIVRRDKC